MTFEFSSHERVIVLIDGANLYATCRSLGIDLDFRRLLFLFRKRARIIRALYYRAIPEDSPLHPVLDWLEYNGFSIITKPTKEFSDASGQRRIKGSMDIELAVDAMLLSDSMEHLVLISGNGDFSHLVAAIQNKGKKVTVVSTLRTNPPFISDTLRRQADHFVDLADLKLEISRGEQELHP